MFKPGIRLVRPLHPQHTFSSVTSIMYYEIKVVDMLGYPTIVSAHLLGSQQTPTLFAYETSLRLIRRFRGRNWVAEPQPTSIYHLRLPAIYLLSSNSSYSSSVCFAPSVIFYLMSSSCCHPSSTLHLPPSFFSFLSSILSYLFRGSVSIYSVLFKARFCLLADVFYVRSSAFCLTFFMFYPLSSSCGIRFLFCIQLMCSIFYIISCIS